MRTRPPPAFPQADQDDYDGEGMTLRDYFAAKAMAGIFFAFTLASERTLDDLTGFNRQSIANEAFAMADAMMKSRGVGR